MGSKGWSVGTEVPGLQLITTGNDNGSTFGRFNLLAKSYEYEWTSCVYFFLTSN